MDGLNKTFLTDFERQVSGVHGIYIKLSCTYEYILCQEVETRKENLFPLQFEVAHKGAELLLDKLSPCEIKTNEYFIPLVEQSLNSAPFYNPLLK